MNVAEELKFVSGRVENIVGKGENTGDLLQCKFCRIINPLPDDKL